jgi:hypothetical protein
MIKQCPNCEQEFVEHFENYYRCSECGWFQYIDDQWRSVPAPKRVKEPPPPEPEPPQPPDPDPHHNRNPPDDDLITDDGVREYLGGLITVEEYDDEENDAEENA